MQLKRGRPPGESCGGLLLGGDATIVRRAMYHLLDLHLCRESASDGAGWPPDPARFADPRPVGLGSIARLADFVRIRRRSGEQRPHDKGHADRPRPTLTIVK
jgi:hypothetical protein